MGFELCLIQLTGRSDPLYTSTSQFFFVLNPKSLNLSQKKDGKCRQAGLAQSIDK